MDLWWIYAQITVKSQVKEPDKESCQYSIIPNRHNVLLWTYPWSQVMPFNHCNNSRYYSLAMLFMFFLGWIYWPHMALLLEISQYVWLFIVQFGTNILYRDFQNLNFLCVHNKNERPQTIIAEGDHGKIWMFDGQTDKDTTNAACSNSIP